MRRHVRTEIAQLQRDASGHLRVVPLKEIVDLDIVLFPIDLVPSTRRSCVMNASQTCARASASGCLGGLGPRLFQKFLWCQLICTALSCAQVSLADL